jgi:hypothetical protein
MVDSRPSGLVFLVQVVSPDGKQLAPVLDSPQPVGIKAELCVKSLMNCARIGLLVVETTDDHSLFGPHDEITASGHEIVSFEYNEMES